MFAAGDIASLAEVSIGTTEFFRDLRLGSGQSDGEKFKETKARK